MRTHSRPPDNVVIDPDHPFDPNDYDSGEFALSYDEEDDPYGHFEDEDPFDFSEEYLSFATEL